MQWRGIALGLVCVVPASACATILGIDDGIPRDGGGSDVAADAPVEAAPPRCNPSAPFQTPVPLTALNTPGFEATPRLSPDELTVFFERLVMGDASSNSQIFMATRASSTGTFSPPSPVTELNAAGYNQEDPTLSPNALRVFFVSDRPGSLGLYDIWQADRDAATAPFTDIGLTPNVSSTQDDRQTYYVPGALYFTSTRGTNYHIYRAAELSGGFASPLQIIELASAGNDYLPTVTPDELRIYFASNRLDGGAGYQIWTSVRTSTSQPWPTPTLVSELASFGNSDPSWISADGCHLYLSSDQSGNEDMYFATK